MYTLTLYLTCSLSLSLFSTQSLYYLMHGISQSTTHTAHTLTHTAFILYIRKPKWAHHRFSVFLYGLYADRGRMQLKVNPLSLLEVWINIDNHNLLRTIPTAPTQIIIWSVYTAQIEIERNLIILCDQYFIWSLKHKKPTVTSNEMVINATIRPAGQ